MSEPQPHLIRLADALSKPFDAGTIAEEFGIDSIRFCWACAWAVAQNIAVAMTSDHQSIYALTPADDDPIENLALDFARAILRCETLARLAAKE